jgi:hypothetical protein
MKKVIAGRMYDTDTAEVIGSASFSHEGDCHHWTETLYKTKNGRYFVFGTGGAMSQYRIEVDFHTWSPGSDIWILDSEKEAYDWAELHLDVETLEAQFSHLLEEG